MSARLRFAVRLPVEIAVVSELGTAVLVPAGVARDHQDHHDRGGHGLAAVGPPQPEPPLALQVLLDLANQLVASIGHERHSTVHPVPHNLTTGRARSNLAKRVAALKLSSMTRPGTYREFWPFYVREHLKPATRRLHFVGTAGVFAFAAAAAATADPWLLLAVPVCGYGFAWSAHAFVERNRPATFTHPLWSLAGDFHMFFLMLSGRMASEVERHADGPSLSAVRDR